MKLKRTTTAAGPNFGRFPSKINEPKKKTKKEPSFEERLRRQQAEIQVASMNWLKDHPNAWPGLYAALVREAVKK